MNNGYILLITFAVTILFAGIVYYLSRLQKQRHQETFKNDWNRFEKALQLNDLKGINHYGTLLVRNVHLKSDDLNVIKKEVDPLAEKYSELEELRLLIFNKRLDWDVQIPY